MSSPLRILHVVPYYEHAWAYGGIPRLATAITRGLARRGHLVTVCTTDACDAASRLPRGARPDFTGARRRGRDSSGEAAGPQVRVFRNVSNRLAYHWQFFAPVGLASYLRAHAREFDIAHLHACRNLPGVLAAHALRRADVPYVVSPNGTAAAIERRAAAKRVFDATVGRHMLALADRIVAVSDAEHRQLATLGIPDARIRTVPNPIDESEFTSPRDPAAFRDAHGVGDAPLVLFLGKLTPRKGVDVLLRAFAQLTHARARLLIAGNDMGSGADADALIVALALGRRAHRIGLLRGAARLDALAAADVVVYPSRDEVFGLVALEALLCGTPVVVCNDSGCGEIVAQLDGGHIVPYGEPDTLAAAIDAVLASPHAWTDRVRAAAVQIRERFAINPVCARFERMYQEVLVERRGDRPVAARQRA